MLDSFLIQFLVIAACKVDIACNDQGIVGVGKKIDPMLANSYI